MSLEDRKQSKQFLFYEDEDFTLYKGKMQDVLSTFEENSIDSIVCDPPYELNFMNKGWDNSGVAFKPDTWEHCFKVLKEGGYLLAFGGTRTFHRIACAIEDAGFEIRDTIMYLYGSGFPKSMNIGKGIEAKEKLGNAGTRNKRKIEQSCDSEEYSLKQTNNGAMGEIIETTRKEYIAGTELSKKWSSWGTTLKPAYEPIIVARKPFKGSLVDNILQNGVGGLNIDECRVGETGGVKKVNIEPNSGSKNSGFGCNGQLEQLNKGRFPANVITDGSEEVAQGMPYTKGNGSEPNYEKSNSENRVYVEGKNKTWHKSGIHFDDEGSAMRYFYCAKASKKDRDEGLDLFEEKQVGSLAGGDNQKETLDDVSSRFRCIKKNIHPTVKNVELMQYLVRLVSPKGAKVLDCFMGSGSTGKACMFENRERNANYHFIGIEMTDEYLPIAKARIDYAKYKYQYDEIKEKEERKAKGIQNIFDFI